MLALVSEGSGYIFSNWKESGILTRTKAYHSQLVMHSPSRCPGKTGTPRRVRIAPRAHVQSGYVAVSAENTEFRRVICDTPAFRSRYAVQNVSEQPVDPGWMSRYRHGQRALPWVLPGDRGYSPTDNLPSPITGCTGPLAQIRGIREFLEIPVLSRSTPIICTETDSLFGNRDGNHQGRKSF